MPTPTIPAIALLAALGSGCGGSSSQHSASRASGLPDPQTYAATMDAKERYWWQQPERVVGLLDCAAGMTVVDLGAGTGYFLSYLSSCVGQSGQVLALDADRPMVDIMLQRVEDRRLENVTPTIVAPDDPALTSRSADRVLVVNTWHHLNDRVVYAKKLLDALRVGGLVLIVDFDEDSPKGPPIELRLAPSAVVRELEAAGFSVELLEETLPYQYAVAGRKRAGH